MGYSASRLSHLLLAGVMGMACAIPSDRPFVRLRDVMDDPDFTSRRVADKPKKKPRKRRHGRFLKLYHRKSR